MKRFSLFFLYLFVLITMLLQTKILGQYYISSNSISSGMEMANNSKYKMVSTLAQPLFGLTFNNDFQLSAGVYYIYQADMLTTIDDQKKNSPTKYEVYQNYPNPFNPSTTISYQIPSESFVTLKVYDLLGRELEVLVREEKTAGFYNIKYDATNLSSGIYFYTIRAGDFIQTKKFILLK